MNKLTAPPLPAKGPLGRPLRPPLGAQLQGMPPSQGAPQQFAPQQQPAPPTQGEIMDALKKTHYLNDGLRALLNKPGGPSRSDVIDETGHLISEGVLSSQQAAQELQSLPTDNAQIKTWLQNHVVNSTISRGKLFDMLGGQGAQQPQASQPQPPQSPPMQNALTSMPNG